VASAIGALVWLLGESKACPAICRRRPFSFLFPDIEGEWKGAIHSNWPIVSQLLSGNKPVNQPHPLHIPVNVRIKARLFSVAVKLVSQKSYSKSHTIVAFVQKCPTDDGIRLSYIYRNETAEPVGTDSGEHMGAAHLELGTEQGQQVLTGHF